MARFHRETKKKQFEGAWQTNRHWDRQTESIVDNNDSQLGAEINNNGLIYVWGLLAQNLGKTLQKSDLGYIKKRMQFFLQRILRKTLKTTKPCYCSVYAQCLCKLLSIPSVQFTVNKYWESVCFICLLRLILISAMLHTSSCNIPENAT